MEAVFVDNLLEATKDLEDDEILFCPMYFWVEALRNDIGLIVEDGGQVRSPTNGELSIIRGDLLYGSHYGERFLYASKPEWTRRRWEELSEMIKKNEEYLKKEIIKDLIYVDPLFRYDLFLGFYGVSKDKDLRIMTESIKTMVEGEVKKEIVDEEKKKKEKYVEVLNKVLKSETFPKGLDLSFVLLSRVREEGTDNYIKGGEFYEEFTKEKKKFVIIVPSHYLKYGHGQWIEALDGIEVNYRLSKPEINKDQFYLVLGKFKIEDYDILQGKTIEMTYLLGLPFFKVKFSSVNAEFRSKNVLIRKREEIKGAEGTDGKDGVVKAGLHIKKFLVTLKYAKEPRVIENGKGIRTIKTNKTLRVNIRREEKIDDTPSERYKVCDIEIQEDGGFSVEMSYRNSYKVKITASDGVAWGKEKEIAEPGKGVSWLIEKWTGGKKAIKSGKIIEENVDNSTFVLKEEKYSDEEDNKMDIYIKSKLEGLMKNILKEKDTEGKKERDLETIFEVISLKPEEGEEIIREIQTGFIQDKVIKNLKYLEKIEELCFESKEGEKVSIKHPETGERIEEATRTAKEAALYGAGISVEKLRGERKSVTEVLKLLSYSFPFLNQHSLNKILSELNKKASSALSKDEVPLKEVDVSIDTINPNISASSDNPKVLALFSIEGDRVKVYINDEKSNKEMTEYLKLGVGEIEIEIT